MTDLEKWELNNWKGIANKFNDALVLACEDLINLHKDNLTEIDDAVSLAEKYLEKAEKKIFNPKNIGTIYKRYNKNDVLEKALQFACATLRENAGTTDIIKQFEDIKEQANVLQGINKTVNYFIEQAKESIDESRV